MHYKIKEFQKYSDKRGDLIVFLRTSDLKKKQQRFGQIYFVTFKKKGVIRGNHYHKKWTEWFGIVEGKVAVTIEDIRTKERTSFILDSKKDKYHRLEIGPYIAHTFQSITASAALLNYADSEWSSKDSIYYKVK